MRSIPPGGIVGLMFENTYSVSGMTCDHCVSAVTGELTKIPGVQNVVVNLADQKVTVTSSAPVELVQVRAAIDEAGYELSTN